ncbi:hypothetical protein POM88_029775 [Heracleum sosnowskyi]|uniref:Uncharacterized protein n=1 Tax=Heracleum sosnowskyi TaxID=360622 RepID=A0AAD8HUB4_9APIA|nr:hypothetical protein POM88_029775 [Heracleum sosnowskyi]
MAAEFVVERFNNYVGYFDPLKCSVERFRPWIRFLNEQSIASYAITASVDLKIEPLRLLCLTAVVAEDMRSFTFTIYDRQYTVTKEIFCQVLHFPLDNFVRFPTDPELVQFFSSIDYQGNIVLPRLNKGNLACEWDLFFDCLAKVFSNSTKNNFTVITSLLQNIAYAAVYNLRLDIGTLVWDLLIRRIFNYTRDIETGRKVKCFYSRFLSLVLDHVLSDEHKTLFLNTPSQVPAHTNPLIYSTLSTSSKSGRRPLVPQSYLREILQPQLPLLFIEHPVVASSSAGTSVAPPNTMALQF